MGRVVCARGARLARARKRKNENENEKKREGARVRADEGETRFGRKIFAVLVFAAPNEESQRHDDEAGE